jgi:hypothetical protein
MWATDSKAIARATGEREECVSMTMTMIGAKAIDGWNTLATKSDRDETRERIGQAVRECTIRVMPWPGDPERVRIIPEPESRQCRDQ